jgi:hypothetical protein
MNDPDLVRELRELLDAETRVRRLENEVSLKEKENAQLREEIKRLRRVADVDLSPKMTCRVRDFPRLRDDRPGIVYAIALAPEIAPFRVKVGYSHRWPSERLASFRTACPTATLVGTWPALPSDEAIAHAALPNRMPGSEVFVCNDVEALLVAIDRALGTEHPGPEHTQVS